MSWEWNNLRSRTGWQKHALEAQNILNLMTYNLPPNVTHSLNKAYFSGTSSKRRSKCWKRLPEAAAAMHRSRANLAMWPSMPVKSEFEVLGGRRVWVLWSVWSAGSLKCPCLVAEQQRLWQRRSGRFRSLKVERWREGKGEKKKGGRNQWGDATVEEDVSRHQSGSCHSHTRHMIENVLYAYMSCCPWLSHAKVMWHNDMLLC